MGDGNPRREHASWPELHDAITHHPIFFFGCTPDLLDMSQMVLRTEGPQRLPRGYEIVLYIPVSNADKVGVFHVQSKSFLTSSSAPSSSFVVLFRSLQALFFPSLTLSCPCSSNGTSEVNHALSIPSPNFSSVEYSLFSISWKTLEINKQRHRAIKPFIQGHPAKE